MDFVAVDKCKEYTVRRQVHIKCDQKELQSHSSKPMRIPCVQQNKQQIASMLPYILYECRLGKQEPYHAQEKNNLPKKLSTSNTRLDIVRVEPSRQVYGFCC